MTEEKLRKMITGATVAGTLLIVVLLAVLIFQWVKIGVQANRIEKLDAEGVALEQQKEGLEEYWAYINTDLGKTDLAMQQDWINQQK